MQGLRVWISWDAAIISLGTPTPSSLLLADCAEEVLIRILVTDSIPWVQEETVKLLGINFHTKVFIFWKAPENGA